MKFVGTIKLNKDFQRVYKKGTFKAGRYIVIYALFNNLSENRIGITVSKKFGNSVQRNRIKRLIKENYRKQVYNFKTGYDIVFLAKAGKRVAATPVNKLKAAYIPNFKEIENEMVKLSGKLKVLNEDI